jgi:hypothetical protein
LEGVSLFGILWSGVRLLTPSTQGVKSGADMHALLLGALIGLYLIIIGRAAAASMRTRLEVTRIEEIEPVKPVLQHVERHNRVMGNFRDDSQEWPAPAPYDEEPRRFGTPHAALEVGEFIA